MNYYEYRLHEIEVLLSQFPDETPYKDEIRKLTEERQTILQQLRYKE